MYPTKLSPWWQSHASSWCWKQDHRSDWVSSTGCISKYYYTVALHIYCARIFHSSIVTVDSTTIPITVIDSSHRLLPSIPIHSMIAVIDSTHWLLPSILRPWYLQSTRHFKYRNLHLILSTMAFHTNEATLITYLYLQAHVYIITIQVIIGKARPL